MLNPILLATEGLDDEAVAKKICAVLNIPVSASYPAGGKTRLDPKLPSYNRAAAHAPWLVLRDLDADAPCPSQLCGRLIAEKAPALLLRTKTHDGSSGETIAETKCAVHGAATGIFGADWPGIHSQIDRIFTSSLGPTACGNHLKQPQPLHQGSPPFVSPLSWDNTFTANTR